MMFKYLVPTVRRHRAKASVNIKVCHRVSRVVEFPIQECALDIEDIDVPVVSGGNGEATGAYLVVVDALDL